MTAREKKQRSLEVGKLGEQIVANWLQGKGWTILHHRWHCRWGEIDLVARSPDSSLVFVEVKTRSCGNWDFDGLLAVTPQKQAKLWQTAELFLAEFPDFANFACRFDLALVSYRSLAHPVLFDIPIAIGQPVGRGNYEFVLKDYLEGII